MNLTTASTVSDNIIAALAPACQRIEVAGSIRRRADPVGDIDIVLIASPDHPKVEFGQKTPVFRTALDGLLWKLEQQHLLTKTAGGDKLKKYMVDISKWGISLATPVMVKMQITIATPETWAYWYLIRTGPADFSHWIVTPKSSGGALPDGIFFEGSMLHLGPAQTIPAREELDIFNAIGLRFLHPGERRAQWNRRSA